MQQLNIVLHPQQCPAALVVWSTWLRNAGGARVDAFHHLFHCVDTVLTYSLSPQLSLLCIFFTAQLAVRC